MKEKSRFFFSYVLRWPAFSVNLWRNVLKLNCQLAQQEKGIAAAVLSKKNLWRTDAHFSFFIFGVMSTYQPEAEFVKKLHTQLVNRLFYPQKRLLYYEYCCMIKRTKFILYKKWGLRMKMSEQELSKEWIELVKEAMRSNTSKEKFEKFLKEEKKKREYNN